jgi:protein FAM50
MGDFQHNFRRPDAGSHTVEGNVSGSRAAMLEKQRLKQQEEFEQEKAKRKRQMDERSYTMASKFQPAQLGSTEEQAFRQKTVGLVSAQDFVNASREQEQEPNDPLLTAEKLKLSALEEKMAQRAKKKRKKETKKAMALLSFGNDEEGDEEDNDNNKEDSTRQIMAKDPTVDTSFLPDKQREQQEMAERQRLEQEWKDRQVAIKKEQLEIVYSYWDGSGHRRSCTITKEASIGDFLEVVRKDLSKEFREMTNIASDALLYVKEDLIVPQDLTFYDLIVTKARGKSGPLFHFDVHDDIRIGPMDIRVEKDESHPGKVVERRWYEKNKHIFPASRWELFSPTKDYGKYSIHGGEVNNKT